MSASSPQMNPDDLAPAFRDVWDWLDPEGYPALRKLEEQLQTTQNILVEERRWRDEAQKDALYIKEQLETAQDLLHEWRTLGYTASGGIGGTLNARTDAALAGYSPQHDSFPASRSDA